MCYCSSFESFSQSFSWSSLLLPNSYFFFRSSFNSFYSRWYLAFSYSFAYFICSNWALNNSYSRSAATFSSLASSNSFYSLVDSFLRVSTWLQTSCSYVLDLFSLTANSERIFSDILDSIWIFCTIYEFMIN